MDGLLKFITCGSVDDGKSTLIGHILYNAKLLYADQEKALLLDSKVGSRGGEIDYSLLLDGLMAEREQGITIDVAYRYFTTDRRSFIVADTPGHEEYTRNMAVGASFAQLAVILVDAVRGVLTQTRRHARICALMGIRHFVFAVNKMDLAGYSAERFAEIEKDIRGLAESLSLEHIKIIPVSATEGDNLTEKSAHTEWYTGEPLLQYLENVDVEETTGDMDFYMPVQRVCRPSHEFRGFQGQIESGSIRTGQEILTYPSRESAAVRTILAGDKEVAEASAGQAVTIRLDREVDVSRGCVLADGELPVSDRVSVTLLWMDDEKLSVGKEYLVKLGTRKIPGTVTAIQYKIDVNSGEKLETDSAGKNEIVVCSLEFSEKITVDRFKAHKTLGELILVDRVSHMTCACGVVEQVDMGKPPYFENGDIKSGGYIFEEFYFDLERGSLSRGASGESTAVKTYRVGDTVPVEGDSFNYPDFFDIIAVEGNAAVRIRNRQITEIISLEEYQYMGLPILDERGFALKISSQKELGEFLEECAEKGSAGRQEIYHRWSCYETYRRIVCTDNFWVI